MNVGGIGDISGATTTTCFRYVGHYHGGAGINMVMMGCPGTDSLPAVHRPVLARNPPHLQRSSGLGPGSGYGTSPGSAGSRHESSKCGGGGGAGGLRNHHSGTSGREFRRTMTSDTEDTEECVEKYQSHFAWLRDTKFLQDLENDSVDSEIIEEELSALQEEEVAISKRKKVVKFLQSNPVQILLCVVVLLDAVIVIAQILLDLNSVKNRLYRREEQMGRFLNIVRIKWPDELHGYEGHDYEHILSILEDHLCDNVTDSHGHDSGKSAKISTTTSHLSDHPVASNTPAVAQAHRDAQSAPPGYHSSESRDTSESMTSSETRASLDGASIHAQNSNRINIDDNMQASGAEEAHSDANSNTHKKKQRIDCSNIYHKHGSHDIVQHVEEDEHDVLHEVAHGLHFASVAFLGFLVLEDLVKIIAMGNDFFRHKIEIFDAIIIVSSFIFDIVFLGGVTGEEGKKAAAILVILLLWRIARVVDGILVTVKQRQEFRIRLQKRSRRTTERKIDLMEDERHLRIKQIQALKELCSKAGVRDEDVEACTPRRGPRRVSTTMCALSSVARLSVSMTMSMSSGLFSLVDDEACTEENVSKPLANRFDRRFSSNSSKGREYLGPYDTQDCSPKITKKRSVSSAPSSPGLGPSTHESLWLPKVDESSLESTADANSDSVQSVVEATSRSKGKQKCNSNANHNSLPLKKVKSSSSLSSSSSSLNTKKENNIARITDVDVQAPPKPEWHLGETDSRVSSPENSCGVQIVIDEGSEVNSNCSQETEETESLDTESYLSVGAAFNDADRRASATSQIFLLSEIP